VIGMMDLVLALLLVLTVGALLWMDRARLLPLVSRPPQTLSNGEAASNYYWRLTRQAGLVPFDVWPLYMGAKVALAVGLPLLALRVAPIIGWWALLVAIAAFLVPDAILAFVRRQRRTEIRHALSFFLDLLVSLLHAGLGIEAAFARTAREGLPKGHPLAVEATQLVEELSLGRDRSHGFQSLAERTGVSDLRGLANALSVGLTHGSSIEATLRMQAELMRTKRRDEALKRLHVASAEVLLPLMLCGFPVFTVLVLFPLGIQIMQSLTALGGILQGP
jgi:tight adherence protein C